jgi:RNA polymerase sigma-70 factor (ECF subfamily)
MLGSAFDADDAVQETMVRAWTRQDSFEGRSSLHTWLYRIATNVCLDMLRGRRRRAVPMDLDGIGAFLPDGDERSPAGDPAEAVVAREAVRLAFVSALQHLPARQRAVLILRDVLRWPASEVAELLGTTVASVNSVLQRARATLAARNAEAPSPHPGDAGQRALLARYVVAFQHHDIASLVTLLQEDAAPAAARG